MEVKSERINKNESRLNSYNRDVIQGDPFNGVLN